MSTPYEPLQGNQEICRHDRWEGEGTTGVIGAEWLRVLPTDEEERFSRLLELTYSETVLG